MENTKESKKIYTNTFFVAAAAILCCALWGSATPFIKIGYELILPNRNVPSTLLFAGVRFTLAGIITVLIYSIGRRKILFPKKENFDKVAKIGAVQTVLQYIFFYVGLANTTGVKGTILSGSSTFFAIIVSSLIFRLEKLTVKKIVNVSHVLERVLNLREVDSTRAPENSDGHGELRRVKRGHNENLLANQIGDCPVWALQLLLYMTLLRESNFIYTNF